MRTNYDPSLKANITLDDSGQIRGINHLDKYRDLEHLPHHEAATAYVRSIAEKLNVPTESLRGLDQPVSYTDPKRQPVEYRLSENKAMFDTATYAYSQTYLNTPVWAAGITVTVTQEPARIIGATNTSEHGID